MNFYTNIAQWGNQLLLREVVNVERLVRKVKYSPTLTFATGRACTPQPATAEAKFRK